MSRRAPEPWATWMVEAGIVNPRGRTPQPSMRELAARVDVTATTIAGMMFGDRHTEHATVARVAGVLNVDVREVSDLVGQARSVRAPYVVPDKVHLLSAREQAAITSLILAIAEERESRDDTTPIAADNVRLARSRGLPVNEPRGQASEGVNQGATDAQV